MTGPGKITIGEIRFHASPGNRRRVHGKIGSDEVVIDLHVNGNGSEMEHTVTHRQTTPEGAAREFNGE